MKIDKYQVYQKIAKYGKIALVLIMLADGGRVVARDIINSNADANIDDTKKVEETKEVKDERPRYMYYNGKEYYAPDDADYLAIVNDEVKAVYETTDRKDAAYRIKENGVKEYYSYLSNYKLDGTQLVKVTITYGDPIVIVDGKTNNK